MGDIGEDAGVEHARLNGDEHVTMQAMAFTPLGCVWSAHEALGAPSVETSVGKSPDTCRDR
jgi:hypothetical protein